jgi:phenylalanyl-tRNA synthetase beta chain
MRISFNWLRDFIKTDLSASEIGDILTDLGLEVEGIDHYLSIPGGLEGVVIGKVLSCEKHPNADKLNITQVDIGEAEQVQIVCGAPNVAAGQTVPVATIGTTLYAENGESFVIKKSKIRGELSQGMICAEDELGLGQSHDGIMVLENHHKAGKPCKEVFEIVTDEIFEIGLTPNRSDAMSHYGVARDLRAALSQRKDTTTLITPSISSFNIDNYKGAIKIDIRDAAAAPRYCGLRITGVEVKASPEHMQHRLKAIGLKPINNIVDATNYVLHEMGQPLHAFDGGKISSGVVRVQKLKEGTPFVTLDGVERKLSSEDLVICNGDTPMCLAGVFGGLDSGVTEQTTEIFLESAYFDPVSIRKTAKRHGLSTDASFRYERGIDIELVKYSLRRAAILIQEVAGGTVSSEIIDEYPNKKQPHQVLLKYDYINKLLGHEIPQEKIKKIIQDLDIKIAHVTETSVGLEVPTYRADVRRPADVVEEVLRVYGYNTIPTGNKLNSSIPDLAKNDTNQLETRVAQQLVAQGFYEIYNNSLTSPKHDSNTKNMVEILNPLSSELAVMRTNLIYGMLEAVQFNINRQQQDLRFFEFGNQYYKTAEGNAQEATLGIIVTGKQLQNNWIVSEQHSDFYFLKGIVNGLLKRLGVKAKETPSDHPFFKESITLSVGKTNIGTYGWIDLNGFKDISIDQEVFACTLAVDALAQFVKQKMKVEALSKFPSVHRDLALLVDKSTSFKELYQIAQKTERHLLEDVGLFDVFTGKGVPEGKKSYALNFTLRDKDKTLTDKLIDKTMQKIADQYQKQLGAELRK